MVNILDDKVVISGLLNPF